MTEVERTISGMKITNEREGKRPDWMEEAMYWLGAFSNAVNVNDMTVRITKDDEGELEQGCIELDGWIIVEPWNVEITTILETTTMPGFAIQTVQVTPGGMWEPDSADVCFYNDYRGIGDAVQYALLLKVEHHMNGIAEHISETKFAAEMADLCM
jgi:hypothetical protein